MVDVSSPTLHYNEDRTSVSVTLGVNEGDQFTIGNISFTGNTEYSDDQLRKQVKLRSGKLYEEEKFQETVQGIRDLYLEKGFLQADIQPVPKLHLEENTVDFNFDITEASAIYVDRIYVDGNAYTKSHVILREVLLKPGDVFSVSRLRRSQERIFNLGFIDDVQPDVQQPFGPTSDKVDLVFNVVEGKPGILSAGAGFSSVDKLLGTIQIQHMNLFGYAQADSSLLPFGSIAERIFPEP